MIDSDKEEFTRYSKARDSKRKICKVIDDMVALNEQNIEDYQNKMERLLDEALYFYNGDMIHLAETLQRERFKDDVRK